MKRLQNYVWMAGFAVLVSVISAVTTAPTIAQAVKAAVVKNVDEPGRSPYHASGSCVVGTLCTITFPAVPANKRLVVQYVSADLQSNNAVGNNGLGFLSDGFKSYANFDIPRIESLNFATGQEATAYIDANAVPRFSLALPSSTAFQSHGILTGYLVDLTQ